MLYLEFVHSVWPFFLPHIQKTSYFLLLRVRCWVSENKAGWVMSHGAETCHCHHCHCRSVSVSPLLHSDTSTAPFCQPVCVYVSVTASLLPGISLVQLYAVLIILIFTWQNVGYSIIKGFRNFKYAHKCLTVRSGRSLMLLVHRVRATCNDALN